MNEFQQEIYKTIDILTEEKLKQLGFDKTKRGKVISVDSTACVVEIDGDNYTCRLRKGIYVQPNDIVFVKFPQNNNVDKYVDTVLGNNEIPEYLVISAEEILAKLKTVDGEGSGLDADMLDGKHGNEFATKEDIAGISIDGDTIVQNINSSTAIIDDKNLSSNVKDKYTKIETDTKLNTKVDKIAGKQLSTEDYTTDMKNKLINIEDGAEKNKVNSVNSKTGDVVINKIDMNLGNVENKSSATIRNEITNTNVTNALGYTPENSSNKGVANGYAPLDSNIKIPLSMLPDIAKQQTYVVETIADRDILSGLIMGEKCYITGTGDSYIWDGTKWQILAKADWENVNLQWTNIVGKPQSNIADIDDATLKRHTHNNKSIIDTITQTLIDRWNSAWNHISDAIRHITSAERTKWNTVDNKADTAYVDVELGKKQDSLGFTPLKEIPVATATTLGGIKVGANLSITDDGTLNAIDDDSKSTFIIKQEIFTATEGQTIFNLTKGHYQPNTNTISIYLYGGKQPNIALNEISSSSFEITEPLKAGDVVLVEYIELSSATPYPIHGSDHLTDGYDPIPLVTASKEGLMSKGDKSKLDGIENGANKYVHPSTHPASIITESSSRRFISDSEKATWNTVISKADKDYVDTELGKKVDNSRVLTDVPLNAKFTDTNTTYSEISTAEIDTGTASTLRVITGRRVQYILNKVANMISALTKSDIGLGNVDNTSDANKPISTATQSALNGKVDSDQVLTNVPANAKFTDTIYTHPSTHPYSMITGTPTSLPANGGNADTVDGKTVAENVPVGAKFTDTITSINNKTGAISKADIVALGIPAQDTIYIHPTSHPASMITESATRRFVSDTEKTNWSNKWDYNEPTIKAVKVNNASNADTVNGKTVVENVPSGAKFTDTITTINGKTGAIGKADIVALGIPAQDTIYTHPTSHPASIIAESTTKRFVSDAEKNNWNSKAEISDIPTKVGQLQNDKNYVTQSDLGEAGLGDMTKGVYDTNNNGKVDIAEVAETVVGNEIQLGGRFKIVYNDIEDSLDIEVI